MSSQSEDLSTVLETLKSQPEASQLLECLRTLRTFVQQGGSRARDLQQLKVSSVLLSRTVPDTYKLLSEESKRELVAIFGYRVPLSQLVVKVDGDDVYVSLLEEVVETRSFARLFDDLDSKSGQYYRNVRSLLLIRVVESLNKARLKSSSESLDRITKDYSEIVFGTLVNNFSQHQSISKLFHDILLEQPSLIQHCFTEEKVYSLLSGVVDWQLFKTLVSHIQQHLRSEELIGSYYTLLKSLRPDDPAKLVILASQITEYPVVKLLLALAFTDHKDSLYKLLVQEAAKFGSQSCITGTPVSAQTAFTKFLLSLAAYASKDQLTQLTTDPSFLNMVSNRLDSTLPRCRTLGMIFTDYVFEQSKGKLLFDVPEYQNERKEFMDGLGELVFVPSSLGVKTAIESISSSSGHKVVDIPRTTLTPIPKVKELPLQVDSDMEDSDDDEYDRVKKVSIPVYLKELLAYLTADSEKDNQAYEKRKIAHSIAPQMIRAKGKSQELHYYSESLLTEVMSMSNQYKFDDFATWRLSTMIAVTVSDFESCSSTLLHAFSQGDLALSMRIMILSCISLSCRELTGEYDDDFVLGKVGVDQFGPKKLPEGLHRQFMQYEDSSSPFTIEDSNLQAISSSLSSLNLGGKVVRKSSKLTKKDAPISTKNTTFINKQLPKLFYSLIGIWQSVNSVTSSGFRLGSFSATLNTEYFRNLHLVYQCAIPSGIELSSMTKDFLLTVAAELRNMTSLEKIEPDLLDQMLKCVKSVTDIDSGILPLKEMYFDELYAIFSILTSLLEDSTVVEERLLGNGVYLVKKLNVILF